MYIASHAGQFLDHKWINIPTLRDFLHQNLLDTGLNASSRPFLIKQEPQSTVVPCNLPGSVKMRTLNKGGQEVLEIVFDSEIDDSDIEVSEVLIRTASRSSSTDDSDEEFSDSDSQVESDTLWLRHGTSPGSKNIKDIPGDSLWQDEITLFVHTGNFQITRKVRAKWIEYLSDLPSIWPIPHIPTVFIVSFDDPKFDITDSKAGDAYTLDLLIWNLDNNSWESGSSTGSTMALVMFGAFACSQIDPMLLNVVCYDLDPSSHNTVLAAQAETRRNEGTTPEQNAVIFMKHVQDAKCLAINSNKCQGRPMMKAKSQETNHSNRKALIVINDTGNNHLIPPLTKVSLVAKETYWQCAKGKTTTVFAPALYNKQIKRDLVHEVKSEQYPNGLNIAGVFAIYLNGLTKPLPKHYIHGYITTTDGGICILTCVPFLLKLLDDPGVIAFDDNTTYKCVEGKMNEVSTNFFEQVFDELQCVKLMVTGKPMPLKTFVPGSNLLVMNVDMDAAQILGICRSIMKHNVPEYSSIPNDTPPEKVALVPSLLPSVNSTLLMWLSLSWPVHNFWVLVSNANYNRLLDFIYIDSKETLDVFSAFVYSLGVNQITDWWVHKEMHEWIIPCLVKSQSLIPADVWDSTPSMTNANEVQYHYQFSDRYQIVDGRGVGKARCLVMLGSTLCSLVIIKLLACIADPPSYIGVAHPSAHQVDKTAAQEIKMSMQTGILSNPNNKITHARHVQLEEEAEKHCKLSALTKSLKEQLKAIKEVSGKKGKSSTSPVILSASSSGHVKSVMVRSEGAPVCTLSTQSDNVPTVGTAFIDMGSALGDTVQPVRSKDVPAPLSTHSDNVPALGTTSVDTVQPEEFSMPNSEFI
ncbi:hypothetical protein B0H10DRAFT_1955216 [Mycena sp. CBHHK59/15]|nr:hypothetical protein B0H10DRAFT_1955216 [Mycena sp. CBHHK59/15]